MVYVLTLKGVPVAAAYRFERMNMAATEYSRDDQQHLLIREVEILT